MIRKILKFLGLALDCDLQKEKRRTNRAYDERGIAAMMAASFASRLGQRVSFYKDNTHPTWEDDWRMVLQIDDLFEDNEGQISWHLNPKGARIAREVFPQQRLVDWDGTFKSRDYNTIPLLRKD